MINVILKSLVSLKVQDIIYEISVRNNKKESISIIVEDQMPISSNTDIEITLADKGGAATYRKRQTYLGCKFKTKRNQKNTLWLSGEIYEG